MAEQQGKDQVYESGRIFLFFLNSFKYSLGLHVEMELKKLAERRTDIFGIGAQETIIGRKVNKQT